MPKTKASLLVIAATAVTVATLFLLPFTPKTAVRTAAVERGDLIRSTLMEGVVAYANEQPLIALQAGRVARVYVIQGQAVRAGDLLVSMDTSVQEQELAAVFGIRSVPSLLFIPREGQPQMALGAMPKGALKEHIDRILLSK